jgi:hypothetical protein
MSYIQFNPKTLDAQELLRWLGGGAMVAKDVASVSDLVVFMKKERLKFFFPSTQHVISMKNED